MLYDNSPRIGQIISRQLWIGEVYGTRTKVRTFLTTKNIYSPSPLIFQLWITSEPTGDELWFKTKVTILENRNWLQAFTKLMAKWKGDALTQHLNVSWWNPITPHSLLFNRVAREFKMTHQCKTVNRLERHPKKALTSVFTSVLVNTVLVHSC